MQCVLLSNMSLLAGGSLTHKTSAGAQTSYDARTVAVGIVRFKF